MKRDLLWVDSRAGLAVGVAVLLLARWLHAWLGLPFALLLAMGTANLFYGLCSGWLFAQPRRSAVAIMALVVANSMWAVFCFWAALHFVHRATLLGLVHLIGEGMIVGVLAAIEWGKRTQLASAIRAKA